MAKKPKKDSGGVPEWVMTYGDLMSLLLVFFVLIVSLSEIKREDQYRAVVEKIQEAFGMKGGGGRLPTDEDPALTLIKRLEEQLQYQNQRVDNEASTTEPGMEGREQTVTKVREGMLYAIGGRVTFEPGSADLSQQARDQLRAVVEKHKIRGTNNIIELRGHTAAMELGREDEARYADLWALSYARARAVLAFLTSDEVGLKPDRFRVVANADREPLIQRAYNAGDQEPNRRVEVLVSEALVKAFTEPEADAGR